MSIDEIQSPKRLEIACTYHDDPRDTVFIGDRLVSGVSPEGWDEAVADLGYQRVTEWTQHPDDSYSYVAIVQAL